MVGRSERVAKWCVATRVILAAKGLPARVLVLVFVLGMLFDGTV